MATRKPLVVSSGVVGELAAADSLSSSSYTTPATAATNPTYGSDLLAGIGAFASATGWTLGSGWSITGGQAVYTSGGGTLSATIAVVSGTKYQIDWTHVSGTYNVTFTAGAVSTMSSPYWANKSLTFVAGTTGSVTFSITMNSAATIDALTVRQVLTVGRAIVYQALDVGGNVCIEYPATARVVACTASGVNALQSNTTGYNNTAYGVSALYYNTTGINNTATGASALNYNTTGYNNTANGLNALQYNTTGHSNTASGVSALYSNTTGFQNTASGLNALLYNTTGYNNTASGVSALQLNTTGHSNTASGAYALYYNTTGYNNTASGLNALLNNTTGYNNTACGLSALYLNTTGVSNTANGLNALYDVRPTSKAITAFSDYSGTVAGTVRATSAAHGLTGTTTKQITGTVNYNGSRSVTVIDADSFYFTATWVATETGWWSISTEGNNNTALGYNTGRGITTGTGNTIIGASVTGLAAGLTNNIILANGTGSIKAQHDGTNWLLSSNAVLPKATGSGIKVDTTTPTWGWRDMTSDINARGTGANDPTFAAYTGTNFYAYQFSASTMQQVFIVFHLPHDYVPGTDIYFHTHWSNAAATPNTGSVVWGFEYSFAKGHQQAAFPASSTVTVTQACNATRYWHHIAETTAITISGLEADGLLMVRVYRDAAAGGDTCTDAVFLHTCDVHYQSTNMATKNKSPDFFA